MSVQPTPDGGALVLMQECSAGCDAWLVKLTSVGTFGWKVVLGGPADDCGYCVVPTTDGGYLVVGESAGRVGEGTDCWLVQVSQAGQSVRDTLIGGAKSDHGMFGLEAGGGFVVCGTTASQGVGKSDVWLFRTDAEWRVVWEQTYGGSENDNGLSVNSTADGGYLVIAWTESFGVGQRDAYVLKTDRRGNCPTSVR